MNETNWENALEDLRHRLDLIQSRAHEDSVKFEELWRQAEFFVVPSLVIARKMDVAKQGKSTWYSISRENVREFEGKWDLIGEVDQGS